LTLGLVGSILLGISSALLVEKLDNTYHTVDTFKEKLKLPLLATIPFDRQLSNAQNLSVAEKAHTASLAQLLAHDSSESKQVAERVSTLVEEYGYYGSSKFLEAFRILHTNIQLLSSDQPIRSIVISSALPGEGKSTIAFNLAQTASAMGQRVLLVDADLRRPKVHNLLELNNLWGLSSIISGNTPVESVIQQAPNVNGLSVITSGPVPPDPTKLLSSQKMKQLMADLHKTFDLVIYDTPPLLGLADPSILASHTDGIMLVARMHKTDRSALNQAIDSLKMTRSNVLGMVINWHKSHSFGYYNYY
jgi:capsular exopolysaccharide synthesis family protein